ncbi:Putative pectate lyase PlyH/PlyE, pectin lyase/virulence factor [Colletotrichum destructivum]|uniref:Pectate lyase n=1 Tax=Colletotrichum destructivum TaxID=34406 RepID=A0AAX4I798_9PEZI|nr:Putative pectate lyase PlyH/PlyE, pectin lyase/virulence factor [Colletotrichum destructivum]
MRITLPLLVSLWSAATQVAAHQRRQAGAGDPDATQADLSARPPPRFPYPVTRFPVANETVVLKEALYILPGQVFDGGMKRYERQEGSCNEQAEGTDADAVFNLMPGSTIRNVIIGKHQAEGIHALGDAWVENVWWEDVCEDALTSKGLNTQLRVIGGGARGASDKIFQDNALGGKFTITGFYAQDFGNFYRSCGNCVLQTKRTVNVTNVVAVNGTRMGAINANYNDEYHLSYAQLDTERIVDKGIGNDLQIVPYMVGTGPDDKYALFNETRDFITKFEGTVDNVYEPEDPYPWLSEYWPEGFH